MARVSFVPDRPAREEEAKWDEDIEPGPIGQVPLEEAIKKGFFTRDQCLAIDWWVTTHTACEVSYGGGGMKVGGVTVTFTSRPADALFAQELAADRAMSLGKVFRLLGPLREVIDRAVFLQSTLSDLAPPKMTFPARNVALAGRIRLAAGLDIVSAFASEGGCSAREAQAIAGAAADACWALAARRKLRAANDNLSAVRAVA
ncbi:hypothetical protein AB4Z40_31975 [Bosea sp. 2YAB26]|uniref:hypothetical protein n=1 Tax=Bosea sp. 2YAB26 TaxID=3237478 RepID=UPI003F8F6745